MRGHSILTNAIHMASFARSRLYSHSSHDWPG